MTERRHTLPLLVATLAMAAPLFLAGCAPSRWSRETLDRTWVGTPIEVFAARYGEPVRTFQDSDGKTVYQYNVTAIDPTCMYFWVVNKDDVIGDFYRRGWCHRV